MEFISWQTYFFQKENNFLEQLIDIIFVDAYKI